MKNEHDIRTQKQLMAEAALPTRKSVLPLRRSAQVQGENRKIRIALPLPRRPECLTKRALLAAMRAAEMAEWEASGCDTLSCGAMHQPVHAFELRA